MLLKILNFPRDRGSFTFFEKKYVHETVGTKIIRVSCRNKTPRARDTNRERQDLIFNPTSLIYELNLFAYSNQRNMRPARTRRT